MSTGVFASRRAATQYRVTCSALTCPLEPEHEELKTGVSTMNQDGSVPENLERATWNAARQVAKLFRQKVPLKLYVTAGKILGKTPEGQFLLELQPA